MGADPYWYYVPYEEDKNNALQKLRKREFEAGRYNPVMFKFDESLNWGLIDIEKTYPKIHETIEEIFEDEWAIDQGTSSILDLNEISETECFGGAYILKKEELIKYFNTEKPTREIIENKVWDYWAYTGDYVESVRGRGICITVYDDDMPTELYFAGYSWD